MSFFKVNLLVFTIVLSILCYSPVNAGDSNATQRHKILHKFDVAYGHGPEYIGVAQKEDYFNLGPESFSHDSENNLYVCDTVNKSIKVFSTNSKHVMTIAMDNNIEAHDIIVDKIGNIYVYDDTNRQIHQFNKKGTLRSTAVIMQNSDIAGPLHIVHDNIYMMNNNQEDVLVAKIANDSLVEVASERSSAKSRLGIHGLSGNKYITTLQRMKRGMITVIPSDASGSKSIELPLPGIVSIVFLKEDRFGNFYVQTERTDDGKVILEVHKFDSSGELADSLLIEENDYAYWMVKLLSVDEDGNIFQFVTKKSNGHFNVRKLQ
jgi:hypothetical protein